MQSLHRILSNVAVVAAVILLGACSVSSSVVVQVVEGISPSPGETNVDTGSVIRIDLQNEPSRNHLQDTIQVYDEQDRPVSGTVRAEPFSVVFVPDAELRKNSTYRVCIDGLRTASGSPIRGYRFDPELEQIEPWSSRHCYRFSTKPTLEVAKTVFDRTDSVLRIYFSDDVAADSLLDVEVRVGLNETPIDSRIRYNPDMRRLTILLDPDHSGEGPIVVTLPDSVHSLDGNHLANGQGDEIVLQDPASDSVVE